MNQPSLFDYAARVSFDGASYEPKHDLKRLTGQILRVFDAMKQENWHTLSEISTITGDPEASVSAQLRHLRKPRFGSHTVERRSRGDRANGLWEYRLIVNRNNTPNLFWVD